ncbi:hypothetical protein Ahia01_000323800 [Argonauta hians]
MLKISVFAAVAASNCQKSVADVMFVLDDSGSVGLSNFGIVKQFVADIVKAFNIGSQNVRVGAITFSSRVKNQFNLNKYHDLNSLLDGINKIKFGKGYTFTNLALDYVREKSFTPSNGDRSNVINIVIVVTDGRSTQKTKTIEAASRLHKTNTVVFVIGVGSKLDAVELNSIASKPSKDHIYNVKNFDILESIKNKIINKTCEVNPCDASPCKNGGQCNSKGQTYTCSCKTGYQGKDCSEVIVCEKSVADVMFVLDDSGSVGLSNFGIVKQFVGDIVKKLNIGSQNVRVGAITFSSRVRNQFNLNKYHDLNSLVQGINKIKFGKGYTFTNLALDYVREKSFTPSNGDRSNVINIVIVVTDGRSTQKTKTIEAASRLHKTNTVVFVIGVGSRLDAVELNSIASKPSKDHIYNVKNFEILKSIENKIINKTCSVNPCDASPCKNGGQCNSKGQTYSCSCKTGYQGKDCSEASNCQKSVADVMFVLDDSGSVGLSNFGIVKQFVADIVEAFNIGSQNVRVGAITFSSRVKNQFNLNKYHDLNSLVQGINKIKFGKGYTYTNLALDYVREKSFTPSNGDRSNVINIVIVVTDGRSTQKTKTIEAASRLHKTNTVVFVIGVGSRLDAVELNSIASKPSKDHIYNVKNFDILESIKNKIINKTCEVNPCDASPCKNGGQCNSKGQTYTCSCKTGYQGKDCSEVIVCEKSVADLMFVLDDSGSVGLSNFGIVKQFVGDIVKKLNIGSQNVRVGAITFSSRVKNQFNLNKYHDLNSLVQGINKIKFGKGYTFTNLALDYVREKSFTPSNGDRNNVINIVIVVTDGRSTQKTKTIEAASRLHKTNTVVFVIGVGSRLDAVELNSIASKPSKDHIYNVKNFEILKSIENKIINKTCAVNPCDASPCKNGGQCNSKGQTYSCSCKTGYQGKDCSEVIVCQKSVADLMFVLDDSGSVGLSNFGIVKQFVGDIVKKLNIGSQNVRVGAITFSSRVKNQFNLNKYQDLNSLLDGINKIKFGKGYTYTNLALDYVREKSFTPSNGDRSNVINIVIVVTDGRSTRKTKTIEAASRLHKTNTVVFVIGVGSKLDAVELNSIASKPSKDHIYNVKNFAILKSIENKIINKTCAASNCQKSVADVMFVLDDSGSVGLSNFGIVKQFVADIVEAFNIGSQNVRVGAITFSSRVKNQFNLNKYHDLNSLVQGINKIKFGKGYTYTNLALDYVREKSFTPSNGDRSNVINIVIVVTDGRSTQKTKTIEAASRLHKTNTVVFVIGVGSKLDAVELNSIASKPSKDHIYNVKNFDILESIKNKIINKTCEVNPCDASPCKNGGQCNSKGQTYTCSCKTGYQGKDCSEVIVCEKSVADVMFVLDDSGSVGLSNFGIVKQFVGDIVKKLNIGSQNVRVGAITFSSRVKNQFNLNKYQDLNSLLDGINKIKFGKGYTFTNLALDYVREKSFTPSNGDRSNVINIVIVVTDGRSTRKTKTIEAASRLHKTNTVVFVIGVGSKLDAVELNSIASKPSKDHIYNVKNFAILKSIENKIINKTCEVNPCDASPCKNGGQCNSKGQTYTCSCKTGYQGKDCSEVIVCQKSVADLMFVLDDSGSVGLSNFGIVKQFVGDIVKKLNIGSQNVRVGAITFSSRVKNQFNLNKYQDLNSLLDGINKIKFGKGYTYTNLALDYQTGIKYRNKRPNYKGFL